MTSKTLIKIYLTFHIFGICSTILFTVGGFIHVWEDVFFFGALASLILCGISLFAIRHTKKVNK